MIQADILKNKYLQIALIIAVIVIIYKLLNSDLFKGLGKGAQGVGEAAQGLGAGIGAASQATGESAAKIITSYSDLVAAAPTKFGQWTGLLENPANKKYLNVYENLPFSEKAYTSAPFLIPSAVAAGKTGEGVQVQSYDWLKKYVAIPVKEAEGTFTYDGEAINNAIDKCRTWVDFMRAAERFKAAYGKSLRVYLDKALNEEEKVQLAKIMLSKPLYRLVPLNK